MKKVFSVLVALALVFALCVPALAGTSVDALTDPEAKAFADTVVNYATTNNCDLRNEMHMQQAATEAAKVLAETPEKIADTDRRAEIANLAVAALAADYALDEAQQQTFESFAVDALKKAYTLSDLGMTNFDPSEVVDNIADGFSGNDLAGLFDTMRNTITDLSDRLSKVFNPNGGDGGNGGNGTPGDNNENNNDDNFGGNDPTGDTAVYAVAGVAAAAAVVLIATKKKSK